jgi:hypothetical protein
LYQNISHLGAFSCDLLTVLRYLWPKLYCFRSDLSGFPMKIPCHEKLLVAAKLLGKPTKAKFYAQLQGNRWIQRGLRLIEACFHDSAVDT